MYVSQALQTQQNDMLKASLLIYNTHISFSIHVNCLRVLLSSRKELSTFSCSTYKVPRSLTLAAEQNVAAWHLCRLQNCQQ